MNKYQVSLVRIAYQHTDVEIYAKSEKEAKEKAIDSAGDILFPIENASDYEVTGIVRLLDKEV